MTGQTKKAGTEYIGYEYREIKVSKEYISLYLDGYSCFGWEPDPNRKVVPEDCVAVSGKKNARHTDRKMLCFRRNRNISNKAELTRLQRNFDYCMEEIEKLNRSKATMAFMVSLSIGILGTVFMTGSVFAFTADPPIIWLMILTAIPGFMGWILPYFIYRRLIREKTEEINPLIEKKYEEIHTICKKGNNLLY